MSPSSCVILQTKSEVKGLWLWHVLFFFGGGCVLMLFERQNVVPESFNDFSVALSDS